MKDYGEEARAYVAETFGYMCELEQAEVFNAILAGRAAGLEEAAKVCEESKCTSNPIGPLFSTGWNEALPYLAQRIRALIQEEK